MFAILENLNLRHFAFRRKGKGKIDEVMFADDLIEEKHAQTICCRVCFGDSYVAIAHFDAGVRSNAIGLPGSQMQRLFFEPCSLGKA